MRESLGSIADSSAARPLQPGLNAACDGYRVPEHVSGCQDRPAAMRAELSLRFGLSCEKLLQSLLGPLGVAWFPGAIADRCSGH